MHNLGRILRLALTPLISVAVAIAAGAVSGKVLLRASPENLGILLAMFGLACLALGGAVGWLVWRCTSRWIDWRRIEAEQKLWESGHLGRAWLRIRQRLSDDGFLR